MKTVVAWTKIALTVCMERHKLTLIQFVYAQKKQSEVGRPCSPEKYRFGEGDGGQHRAG